MPADDHRVARDVAGIGAAIVVGTALYDIYDAHRAAERTNRRPWWGITATPMPSGAGVAIAGRF
jgi:hypothetical protein